MKRLHCIFSVLSIFIFYNAVGQSDTYIVNGSARQDKCNCYTLTPEKNDQSGSVWNKNKIDLTQSFDFIFNVYLGCKDIDGADGMVFILQTVRGSIGRSGSGLGFDGVSPSIGIELDTWQNIDTTVNYNDLNDPPYDHISIQANGNVRHGNDLAGPVPASATSDNIEDCQWHLFRINWDASTHHLLAYFDGVLRVETKIDLVKDIFNDPMVYWGLSGATGGFFNVQQFCTALNPKFSTDITRDTFCSDTSVRFIDQSESFAPVEKYFWDFGDGTVSDLPNPPVHYFGQPGIYNIKHAITGKDGCNSDTIAKTISIGSKPHVDFSIFDTCFKSIPRIENNSSNAVGDINEWNWLLNGKLIAKDKQPALLNIPIGKYNVQLFATSVYGCPSDTLTKMFVIKPIPQITAAFNSGCVNQSIAFSASQLDNAAIAQWNWDFGDHLTAHNADVHHVYHQPGTYLVQSWAVADNGCPSEISSNTVTINQSYAFAGNDTIVLRNVPFQLSGKGNGSFTWQPPDGLDNNTIPNPTSILNEDQSYVLTVTTPEGCVAKDTITIKVFKGSAIYVPNAFSPDGNGLNDRLKPLYIGIKKLEYFTIYNRWGQQVFFTTNMNGEWNGMDHGNPLSTGTYVWILKAVDIVGKIYQMKGTVTLIH